MIYVDYGARYNDIIKGYRYDTATGVRTYKSYNVNGNDNLSVNLNSNYRFGSTKQWSVHLGLSYNYSTFSNMIGTDAAPTLFRTINNGGSFNPSISYSSGRFDCYYSFNGSIMHAKSNLETSTTRTNYGMINNSFGGMVKLPANFSISTKLTVLTRMGYLDEAMNKTEVQWSAQADYTFGKGKWVATVKAYDILGQISEVDYIINAQGRTQSISNVLPRYVLFKIAYRFDFKPKRAKNANP